MRKILTMAAMAAGLLFSTGAHAACDPGKPGGDLTGAEAQKVYDCMAKSLHDGYMQGNKNWVPAAYAKDYRTWTKVSSFPAAPGAHGERFLLTWVNDKGAKEYLRYADNPNIPAGTLIAKESFSVGSDGKASPGPLFLMEKVAAGTSPATGDWFYMLVAPDGNAIGVDVVAACSTCHLSVYGHQGGLGYPVEEARIK
jgi:hypothetical protein